MPALIPGAILRGRYRVSRSLAETSQLSALGGPASADSPTPRAVLVADTLRGDAPLVFKPAPLADAQRLWRELELLGDLAHPNLSLPIGLVLEPELELAFLVSTFHVGGDLRAWSSGASGIATSPSRTGAAATPPDSAGAHAGPPDSERVAAAIDVLRGLAYVHERGIVHRDLKLENAVRDSEGRTRLIDFGLALAGGGLDGARPAELSGTPSALAPELLRGAPPSSASDMFAFGVLLFDLLTGRGPFGAAPPDELLRRRLAGSLPETLPASFGARMVDLVGACLAGDPSGRPSARGALDLLCSMVTPTHPRESREGAAARGHAPGHFGRAAVESALIDALEQVRTGRATLTPVIWLTGAPGEGRTATALAARRMAQTRGFDVPEIAPPSDANALARWLGVRLDDASPHVDSSAASQQSLITRLAEAVTTSSARTPTALIIDDLPLAPPGVWRLLAAAVREQTSRAASRLVVVVTAPSVWPSDEASLAARRSLEALESSLAPFASVESLALGPLPSVAIRALLERCSDGLPVTLRFTGDVERLTGASPALLAAAIDRLAAKGALPIQSGVAFPETLTSAEELVPPTLLAEAESRVAAASSDARQVTDIVALLGGRYAKSEVLVLATLLGVTRPEVALEAARGAHLVTLGDGAAGPEVIVAGHATLQAVAAAEGPGRERRAATLAAALSRRGVEAPAVLARLEALAGRMAEAAEWAIRAGAVAEAAAYYTVAVRQAGPGARGPLRRALARAHSTLGAFDAAKAALTPEHGEQAHPDAWLDLAELEIDAGRHRNAIAVLDTMADDDTRSTGLESEENTDRAIALQARARLYLGEPDAALKALDALGPRTTGTSTELDVHLSLTRGLCLFYLGRYDDALAVVTPAAEAVLSAHPNARELPMLLNAVAIIHQRRGQSDEASKWYARSLDSARQLSNPTRVGIALMNLGTLAQEAGRLSEALARYGEAVTVARRVGDDTALAKALMNEANLLVQVGAIESATLHISLGRRLAISTQSRFLEAYYDLLLADARLRDDAPDDAASLASRSEEAFERLSSVREGAEATLVALRANARSRRWGAVGEGLEKVRQAATTLSSSRLRVWVGLLEAERFRASRPERRSDARKSLERALSEAGESERPEDLWRPHLALARLDAADERPGDALTHAHEGRRLLDLLGERLDEPWRSSFWSLVEHREAREALTSLEQTGGPGQKDSRFLYQVLDLNKRLGTEVSPERLLRTILDVAIATTGAERGFVLTADETTTPDDDGYLAFSVRAARNFERETLKRSNLRYSGSIAADVLATGLPLLSVDALDDERLRENQSVHAMRLRSVLCVPMRHRGNPIGVVYVDNRFQRGAFSSEQLAFMEAFADQAAVALHSAQALLSEQTARAAAEAMTAELSRARTEVDRLNKELAAELERRSADLEETRLELAAERSERSTRYRYDAIVGESAQMTRLFQLLDRVTPTTISVLITGESGTGKELVARALHYNGPRAAKPFVSVNCAALPETLLESEFFGYVRGAFTGADRDRSGLFEQAHGGTLFLDEVGEMSPTLQAKLLRALETRTIRRVGGAKDISVDVRIVTATNRDLTSAVKSGVFREDLVFRLRVVEIRLPALHERSSDIPLLATHFLTTIARRHNLPEKRLAPDALRRLIRHPWPGNVRELEAKLTEAVLMSDTMVVTEADLALGDAPQAPLVRASAWDGVSTLAVIERAVVEDAWRQLGENQLRTAEALDMDRNTVRQRLTECGVTLPGRGRRPRVLPPK